MYCSELQEKTEYPEWEIGVHRPVNRNEMSSMEMDEQQSMERD